MSKANSSYQFDGEQSKYEFFFETLVTDLRHEGISYILNPHHLERIRTEIPQPEYPSTGRVKANKARWDLFRKSKINFILQKLGNFLFSFLRISLQ